MTEARVKTPRVAGQVTWLSLSRAANACGLITAAIGLLAIVGWALGLDALTRVLPGLAAMKVNTALGLVALGAGLRLRARRRLSFALGASAAVVGLMTLGEYLGGVDLGIDQVLARDVITPQEATFPPGRMAPPTALCFLLFGVGLLASGVAKLAPNRKSPLSRRLGYGVELLTLTATVIGALSLIAYPSGVVHLRQLSGSISMAAHTAAAFVVFGVGLLCAMEGLVVQSLRSGITGRVLSLGFGVLTCLLCAVGVVFSLDMQTLADDIDAQANVARPRNEAALGLENGVRGYGLSVSAATRADARARSAAAEDALDVEGHLTDYVALADTARHRELAAHIRERWRDFRMLGVALLEATDQPAPQELARFTALRVELERLLEDELQRDAMKSFEIRRAITLNDLKATGDRPLLLLVVSVLLALVTGGAVSRTVLRHEGTVREQREWLSVTLSSIGDGVIACDLERRVSFLNPVAGALTGWTSEEALGKPIATVLRLVNEQTRAPAADIVEQVLSEGRVVAMANHTALLARDGREVPIEDSAAPIADALGRVTGAVLVFHDVTQRRRALAELKENEARLRILSSTASQLLAVDDPQEVVNELCKRVMDSLGCQVFFNFLVDEDEGRLHLNASAGIPDEEARQIEWVEYGVEVCGRVARDRQRIITEDVLHGSDARTARVRSYGIQAYCCHPLLVQGRLLGTLSFGTKTRVRFSPEEVETMRTVTDQVATAMERMEARRALRAANARLVEADRRKNEFLAVLSHELRNPLAPIQNSLHILERAEPGEVQARRAQLVIGRQAEHLSHLVDDLLDVTRISQNKIRLDRGVLELNQLVSRTVEDHATLFEQSGVSLVVSLRADAVRVNGDATRLAQVVGNLLQNAAKFTGRGGRATVSVSVDEPARQAVVTVADTGAGLSPELLESLFQPFMQADRTLDRSKGGLGLGLALVKGLVELHGGEVTARSEGPGTGAEFVVRLPLAVEGVRGLEAPATSAERPSGRRVLIIEDNVDAADSLREVLELNEHQVAVAYSGFEGLAKAREFRPEVVLCDIGLPGIDGFEVARTLRADQALKDVLLVALTGYALQEDLEKASAAGFAKHLTKPPNIEKLQELLGAS